MKTSATLGLLSILNGALLVALVWGVRSPASLEEPAGSAESKSAEIALTVDLRTPGNPATSDSPGELKLATPLSPFAAIYSDDPTQLAASLRRVGCPEGTVKDILIADVNELYGPREEALKPKPVPQDAPLSRRRSTPTTEDIERMVQLRDVQIEKHAIVQELLGVRIPREMIRTPNSRNWEAYEYAISLLPAEKQEAVQLIQENLWIQDDWNQAQGSDYLSGDAGELAAYRQAAEEPHAMPGVISALRETFPGGRMLQ